MARSGGAPALDASAGRRWSPMRVQTPFSASPSHPSKNKLRKFVCPLHRALAAAAACAWTLPHAAAAATLETPTLGVTPTATTAPSAAPLAATLMGVNAHSAATPGVIDELHAAGFSWIRDDIMWPPMEPRAGSYDFASVPDPSRLPPTHPLPPASAHILLTRVAPQLLGIPDAPHPRERHGNHRHRQPEEPAVRRQRERAHAGGAGGAGPLGRDARQALERHQCVVGAVRTPCPCPCPPAPCPCPCPAPLLAL